MPISISRIVMIVTLIALAVVVYFTMNSCETFNNIKTIKNTDTQKRENFTGTLAEAPQVNEPAPVPTNFVGSNPYPQIPTDQSNLPFDNSRKVVDPEVTKIEPKVEAAFKSTIDYSTVVGNTAGVDDLLNTYAGVTKSALPTKKNDDVNDIYMEGTDTLAAPLADRMYFTNSIANVNRNASWDLRGDIATTYNDKFTPFNQSTIYGEPMTINRLGN